MDNERDDGAAVVSLKGTPTADLLPQRRRVEALAGKVCAAAAIVAQASARMLDLLGEFDAADGFRYYDGCGSTARWLAWACSMSPGTAREHVRIARALQRMPELAGLFRHCRLSYSKVRAATRLAGIVEESGLCELALTMTAAQLDQTVSAYRTSSGSRISQQERRRVTWSSWTDTSTSIDADHARDDPDGVEAQMVSITARLPVDEAAVVVAAIEAARDRQPIGERDAAEALVEVARTFLAVEPDDESGEDRTMVVVQVGAETLLEATRTPDAYHNTDTPSGARTDSAFGSSAGTRHDGSGVPAGTPDLPCDTTADGLDDAFHDASDTASCDTASCDTASCDTASCDTASCDTASCDTASCDNASSGTAPTESVSTGTVHSGDGEVPVPGAWRDVPAETPGGVQAGLRAGRCAIPGVGPIEPATAARLACDATVLGAIVDRDGAVLALGRSRRLVSKAQRRALMVRDRMCRFPGCHRDRHLQAHHLIPWSQGGRTDVENLLLLCQRHHTYVHEGRLILRRVPHGWQFRLPDGRDVNEIVTARGAADDYLACYLAHHAQRTEVTLTAVTGPDDRAARRLRPGWAGEPFSLHACVDALFGLAEIRQRDEVRAAA